MDEKQYKSFLLLNYLGLLLLAWASLWLFVGMSSGEVSVLFSVMFLLTVPITVFSIITSHVFTDKR
jgi:membrane protein DedA with SNARE-associated domain